MVKVVCLVTVTSFESSTFPSPSAFPDHSGGGLEGSVTEQDTTLFALHVSITVVLPEPLPPPPVTGAVNTTPGGTTTRDANAGSDDPPGPEQTT